jgi:hypothetical protein
MSEPWREEKIVNAWICASPLEARGMHDVTYNDALAAEMEMLKMC